MWEPFNFDKSVSYQTTFILTCSVASTEFLMSITLPPLITTFGNLFRNWSLVNFLPVNIVESALLTIQNIYKVQNVVMCAEL